ncbi:MAG TPA: membrane dipeptidase [Terriglobales bacterium]|nr:membrane dipeptidase [Terriglobales bacterium]
MDRRDFLVRGGRLACAAAVGASLPAISTSLETGVEQVYRRAVVIDSLGSPLVNDEMPPRKEELEQVAQAGVTAVHDTVSHEGFEATVKAIAYIEVLVEKDPARWLIVRRISDVDRAKREGKTGIIMGFQFTAPIEGDSSRIETFRRLGVRIMQLTYNNRSNFGDGCLEPRNAGLTKEGRAAIEQMNTLGVAVDLSHCGHQTTKEGLEASQKPPLITHSGCSAVYDHPRNKYDSELKLMADRGGYVGIYLMPYLVASPTPPTKEIVLSHITHALNVCGTQHVGIGSDGAIPAYPDTPEARKRTAEIIESRRKAGIAAPGEDRPPLVADLNTPRRYEIIAGELNRRGYSDSVVEGVLGGNFYRVLGEIWGQA